MWVEFLITSLIVVIAPGTGVIYTVGVGLARGAGASFAAAAVCTCGIIPHMTGAIAGLAALLHTSAVLFQTFKWAGILYLLYLAWSILKDDGPIQFKAEGNTGPLRNVAAAGFLINILNPKLSIFFLAFLPQFVPTDTTSPLAQMFVLSGIFMAMTFAVFICYGAFASRVRLYVQRTPSVIAWLKRGFSAAFLLLAMRLAIQSN
ncbi:LysE family translocator [Roseibium aggregatum]|uniref:LysE family translocator n=1 Tax=Roseibium aggregatum TaxID=187304 RepID=UPI000967B707|nr:LysE family translocator [Roseibium aggregatum]UFI04028.1 LysE family translocator [Roseibium aggregatum]